MRSRNIGLDVMKILLALIVFFFHCYCHLGIHFGVFQHFIEQGAVAMTGFFMLSGYIMYLIYRETDYSVINNLRKFYIKRLATILPVYYVVGLVYTVLWIATGRISAVKAILIFPVELLGLQSVFSSLFSIAHNQGTWFISCLLLCYFIFPLICFLVKNLSKRDSLIGIVIMYLIASYPIVIIRSFDTMGVYSNPFFRGVEFTIGVMLGRIIENFKAVNSKSKMNIVFIPSAMLLWGGVTLISKSGFSGYYTDYNFFVIPVFCIMIIGATNISFPGEKIITYCSQLSLCFFLGQMFTWKIVEYISEKLLYVSNDFYIVLIAFAVCFLTAVFLNTFVEKKGKIVILSMVKKQ